MTTSYERGRNAEYTVKRMLQDKGYFVLRSAGSHTPIDLLAGNGKDRLAVQVKYGGSLSAEAKKELLKLAKTFDATPILTRRKKGRWILTTMQEVS